MRKQMEDSKAKEVGRSRPPTPIPQEESDEISPTGSDENLASRPRLTASQSKPSDLQRDQKMNKGIAYTVNSKARERATIELVDKDVQGTIKNMPRRPLTTVYDQAVQRVQEWNEALNGECRWSATGNYYLTTFPIQHRVRRRTRSSVGCRTPSRNPFQNPLVGRTRSQRPPLASLLLHTCVPYLQRGKHLGVSFRTVRSCLG